MGSLWDRGTLINYIINYDNKDQTRFFVLLDDMMSSGLCKSDNINQIQWKPLNGIIMGLEESDNIIRMITTCLVLKSENKPL